MPFQPAYSLDAINAKGVGVRIAFERTGDRYSHTLYCIHKNQIDAILTSVDDADYRGWPRSIPVQEVRPTRPAGEIALVLMGAAASGHWSVTVRTVGPDANPYLEFDVAVRLARLPAHLGMCYELLGNAVWIDDHSGLTSARLEPHSIVMSPPPRADNSSSNQVEQLKTLADPANPRHRLFVPTAKLAEHYPATYRWQHCIGSAFA